MDARPTGTRGRGHIVCDGLVRILKADGVEVVALQGLDLVVDRGELMALVGASGSGKSTLLTIHGTSSPPRCSTPAKASRPSRSGWATPTRPSRCGFTAV